jgi:hypothetical protein
METWYDQQHLWEAKADILGVKAGASVIRQIYSLAGRRMIF